jgi:hypothetical protein
MQHFEFQQISEDDVDMLIRIKFLEKRKLRSETVKALKVPGSEGSPLIF